MENNNSKKEKLKKIGKTIFYTYLFLLLGYQGFKYVNNNLLESEIVINDRFKPLPVYKELEVSEIKFNKVYKVEEDDYGTPYSLETYVIEYSFNLKNNGDPIVPFDINGKTKLEIDESLVLRNLDNIEGKDEFLNWGDHQSTITYNKNNLIQTINSRTPFSTNVEFFCIGKIQVTKDELETLISRNYIPDMYITFNGTTSKRYKDDITKEVPYVVKQKSYDVNSNDIQENLKKLLSNNSEILK